MSETEYEYAQTEPAHMTGEDQGASVDKESAESQPNANAEADRVLLSIPEQKELAEDSDIEYHDTPGVPGQIQYPENSTFGQYANEDDEEGQTDD